MIISSPAVLYRETAMLAVIRTRPLESARRLVPACYDREQPLSTRLATLDWLARAGPEVKARHGGPGGAFPDYIRIAVLGK
jgi:hypothetical protein